MRITRDNQKVDVIYVNPDGSAWFTPDGIGRIHYDTEQEALDDCLDPEKVTVEDLDEEPED